MWSESLDHCSTYLCPTEVAGVGAGGGSGGDGAEADAPMFKACDGTACRFRHSPELKAAVAGGTARVCASTGFAACAVWALPALPSTLLTATLP